MGSMEKHMEVLADRLRGEVRISVSKATREKAEDDLRWGVVLKLSNGGDFNLQGMASVLKRAWGYNKGVSFLSSKSNVALVKFDSEEKMLKILDGGPWTFDGATVMIRRWLMESSLESLNFDNLQIWVQLHNVPMDMLLDDITEGIARVAGQVKKRMPQDMEVMRRRFVRFQVEINIHNPIIPGCYVDGWDGKPRWVMFKYERLPFFCKRCGVLDHMEASCGSEGSSNRFGMWLRADSEMKWEPEEMEAEEGVTGDGGVMGHKPKQVPGPPNTEVGGRVRTIAGADERIETDTQRSDQRRVTEPSEMSDLSATLETEQDVRAGILDKGKEVAHDVESVHEMVWNKEGPIERLGYEPVVGLLLNGPVANTIA